MHPQNIFGEAFLLFVVGILLIIRDRGSAVSSTAYDRLLAALLITFGFIRTIEFLAGVQDSHIMSRGLVWASWVIPLVILAWMTLVHKRWDVGIVLGVAIMSLIIVTIYLASGAGGYDIITPDQHVGSSNGIFTWIRTDGAGHFLPFLYYVLLAVTLIYLTALSWGDTIYWLLVGATVIGFGIACLCIPEISKNPLGTLGSLSTLVMIAVGVFALLLVPG